MIAVHVTDTNDTLYSYALFNPKIISHSVERTDHKMVKAVYL